GLCIKHSRFLNTPSWMADFSKIEGLATNTDNINYNVYVDTLSQGQSLEFEGLSSEDVSLAVVPYYEMGDGESKRPSVLFEAEDAKFSAKETAFFRKETYVDFADQSKPYIEWEVSTG